MTDSLRTGNRIALTWVARACGLALFLLVALIAIGHGGPPNPLKQPPSVAAQLILMLIMTLGLLVAWRWEVIGALATLIGLIGFNVINVAMSGKLAGGAFALFLIPPTLYLLDAYLRRAGRRATA